MPDRQTTPAERDGQVEKAILDLLLDSDAQSPRSIEQVDRNRCRIERRSVPRKLVAGQCSAWLLGDRRALSSNLEQLERFATTLKGADGWAR
jgi:hypothetical protein